MCYNKRVDIDLQRALKKLEIKSNKQLNYPYILDKDPEFAAKYLTIDDCREAIKLIEYAYKVVNGEEKPTYTLLESQIMNSNTMFNWFAKFYDNLMELEEPDDYYPIPYDKEPKLNTKVKDPFLIFPPLIYENKKVKEHKFPPVITNPIDKWRCLYIKKKVHLSEFREGYPQWYALSNMELFEEYNVMTNIRVKLSFIDGEFRYFIAGASDNWKEIRDVPLEMDHIISALIFRS